MTSYLLSMINNVELLFHINENLHDIHNENVRLDVFENFCFNPFTYNDDVQEVDLDIDKYLLSFPDYKNHQCHSFLFFSFLL